MGEGKWCRRTYKEYDTRELHVITEIQNMLTCCAYKPASKGNYYSKIQAFV